MFNFELNFSIFPIQHETVEICVNSYLLNMWFSAMFWELLKTNS